MTGYVVSSGATWLCPPWAIAPSARVTVRECRSCGARVVWLKTAATGALAPCNADGTSHFSNWRACASWLSRASREEAAL